MTVIERKKVPPIVPKKKPELKLTNSKDTIILPNLKPRNEESIKPKSLKNQSLNEIIDSVYHSNSKYEVTKPNKHEPKVLTLDEIMKPKIRSDIVINQKLSPLPPPIKQKPIIEKKSLFDNTPEFLKETMQKRLQLTQSNLYSDSIQQRIPLPGLVQRANSFPENSTIDFTPNKLTKSKTTPTPLIHPNKIRSKGPKRRLPTKVVSSSSSSSTSNVTPTVPLSSNPIPHQSIIIKKKPPVPPKKKALKI
jgi:hypothetical protein